MAKRTSKVLPGHELQLTSVKVHPHVQAQFQEESLHSISFQKLVNRAMHMYANNLEFRQLILNYTVLVPSGSL